MSGEHRHVKKRHMCPTCEHYHAMPNTNVPGATGMCMLNPPTPFIVGIATVDPVIAREGTPPQQIPIIRAYYPPVGPNETCSQWSPLAEGEA